MWEAGELMAQWEALQGELDEKSRELAAVVVRAMAPAREDRYATAGDLARALGDTTRARGVRVRGESASPAIPALRNRRTHL